MTARQRAHAMGAGAAAGICLVAVVLLYHIPLGDTLGADTLHALGAAAAALACARLGVRGANGATPARRGGKALPCAIAALCVLASLAATLASAGGIGGLPGPVSLGRAAAAALLVALSCLGTAVWEETFFRKLATDAVSEALAPAGRRELRAACICAAVFALMHMGQADGAAQEALRFAQVFLFGLAMSGLRAQTGTLGWAIATHAAYDLVCFLPAALSWQAGSAWEMPVAALSAMETGVPGILASLAALAPAAVLAARELARR